MLQQIGRDHRVKRFVQSLERPVPKMIQLQRERPDERNGQQRVNDPPLARRIGAVISRDLVQSRAIIRMTAQPEKLLQKSPSDSCIRTVGLTLLRLGALIHDFIIQSGRFQSRIYSSAG